MQSVSLADAAASGQNEARRPQQEGDPMKQLTPLALSAALLLAASAGGRAEDKEGKPEVGKPAPEIDLPATSIDKALPKAKDKKRLSLKDLRGKNVVLFFYPKAMTGG